MKAEIEGIVLTASTKATRAFLAFIRSSLIRPGRKSTLVQMLCDDGVNLPQFQAANFSTDVLWVRSSLEEAHNLCTI